MDYAGWTVLEPVFNASMPRAPMLLLQQPRAPHHVFIQLVVNQLSRLHFMMTWCTSYVTRPESLSSAAVSKFAILGFSRNPPLW